MNLLPNSSFEIHTVPDMPDYWDQFRGPKRVDDWYDLWSLDKQEACHGKASLKLVTPGSDLVGKIYVQPSSSFDQSEKKDWQVPGQGKTYILSLYMKSDRPMYRVRIKLNGSHLFKVGTDWRRYEIVTEMPAYRHYAQMLTILPADVGTLWIDAVQLEEGKSASPYAPSPYDKALHKTIPTRYIKLARKIIDDYRNPAKTTLSIRPDRSYYTREEMAHLSVRVRGDSARWQGKPVRLEVSDQKGSILPDLIFEGKISGQAVDFSLPLSALETGKYKVKAKVGDGGALNSETVLLKVPPAAREVKIDHVGRRLLADGEDFFFFAASLTKIQRHMDDLGHLSHLLKEIHDKGYTAVVSSFASGSSDTGLSPIDIMRFFNLARRHGLKVVLWVSPNAVKEGERFIPIMKLPPDRILEAYKREIERLAPVVKDHEALLAWYLCDEPRGDELLKSGFTAKLVSFARGVDPYHPHYVNYGNIRLDYEINGGRVPGDMVSYCMYPIPDRPVTDVAVWTDLLDVAGDGMKGVTPWLQLSAERGRHPTPPEMTAMVYLCAVHGATGFQTWPNMPGSRILWEHMKTVTSEMKALQPVLCAPRGNLSVQVDSKDLHLFSRAAIGGKAYIVAVNASDAPREVSFSSRDIAGEHADVMFENRKVRIENGKFRDSFAALARHVYVLHSR